MGVHRVFKLPSITIEECVRFKAPTLAVERRPRYALLLFHPDAQAVAFRALGKTAGPLTDGSGSRILPVLVRSAI